MDRLFLQKVIKKLPNYFIVVGSYLRGNKNPKDLDLLICNVSINKALKDFKKYIGIHYIESYGKRQAFFISKFLNQKFNVNIWAGNEKEFPILYFNYAYPTTFIIRVKGAFKKKGWKLSQTKLLDDNNKEVKIKNYKDIFKILQNLGYNYPYRSPKQQELKRK
jgi:DNA polymerase/3'-5' exonuclease PolX